jgi:Raf kinase inhibitor-like YbhB/YbcL family protein
MKYVHDFSVKSFALPLLMIVFLGTDSFKLNKERPAVEFKIFSTAFNEGELIPAKYTCEGLNISPPLKWISSPGETKSLAIICNDPDAPVGDWVHWVVYNIPASETEIKEGASSQKHLPKGALEGINDFRKIGYGGPCPPSGTHRYFFKLYALDIVLHAKEGLSKKQLLELMKGHILAEVTLMGKYKRK